MTRAVNVEALVEGFLRCAELTEEQVAAFEAAEPKTRFRVPGGQLVTLRDLRDTGIEVAAEIERRTAAPAESFVAPRTAEPEHDDVDDSTDSAGQSGEEEDSAANDWGDDVTLGNAPDDEAPF